MSGRFLKVSMCAWCGHAKVSHSKPKEQGLTHFPDYCADCSECVDHRQGATHEA